MALRYLKGAEGRTEGRSFLTFVTYVAVGGVALGVAALLLSLAIVRGFSQEITNKIVGFGSHIQVRSYFPDEPLSKARTLQEEISSTAGVQRVLPVVQGLVLLRSSERSIDGVQLLGTREPPPYLEGRMKRGEFRVERAKNGMPSLMVGGSLADRMGLDIGQTVTAFSLRNVDSGSSGFQIQPPRVKQFAVRGVYETSLTNIDDRFVFTNLSSARQIAGIPRASVSRFDVTVQQFGQVDSVAARIERTAGFPGSARTIREIQPYSSLFAWVNLQQSIIPLVIGVIVIVAAFNIIGILLMMILEKTREIGILQSLGTSRRAVKRVFLTLGVLIGVVGTAVGATLALVLGYLQKTFAIIPLPAEAYYMTTAPIELNPLDYVLVGVITIVLCGLAAYVPARVASRIEPVEAIRFQ